MQLNRYLAFRKECILDTDERWGRLVFIMSGVTLMTSMFLLALQNLIALFPGNEQWVASKVLRRAKTTPFHRGSPRWPFERLTICLSWLTFGGSLDVFPTPEDLEAGPFQHARGAWESWRQSTPINSSETKTYARQKRTSHPDYTFKAHRNERHH